jgi:RimJ/RimL family protein N-acetyltransferase
MIPTLETPRLRLRPLAASDEADLVALDSDPEVMRYVGSPPGVTSPAETAERARRRIRESERGALAPLGFWRIEARREGTFRGVGALIRMPDTEDNRYRGAVDVEVAYRLVRSAWGRGLATEAAGALVAHALGPLALPRVVAVTYPENVASQRVLDKLGFEARGFREYKGVRATYHVLTQEAWAARAPGGRLH